ncbi:MAG: undecaprenyl-diphosphate phosphatase [Phycisphaerales bacterium]
MTIFDAIILGLVEGITEYLPISSTGHLIITANLLGLDRTVDDKEAIDAFNIVIQGGAILAVLGLFWPRVRSMIMGLLGRDRVGRRMAVNIIIAFLPAAIVGIMINDWVESQLFFAGPVIAALFLGGVALLFLKGWQARLFHETDHDAAVSNEGETDDARPPSRFIAMEELTWQRALIIGLLQCVAMWPGTSRSMMTIVGGMLVGMRPRDAAEFSFLLGLPTLGGACLYKGYKNLSGEGPNVFEVLGTAQVIVGILVALVAAALAVKWLVGYLKTHGMAAFGWYRIALAIVLLLLVWWGPVTISPVE